MFLLDALEIEKRKYPKLRQLLIPDHVHLPAYHKVAVLRNELILKSSIQFYPDPSNPIGVYYPYCVFVIHTLERILSTLSIPNLNDSPLVFKIADGLDGSGSHAIYSQEKTNTTTKSFILFCFKPISILPNSGQILWNNDIPNSPFSQRPIFLCATKESEANIQELMSSLINPDTEEMKNNGLTLLREIKC